VTGSDIMIVTGSDIVSVTGSDIVSVTGSDIVSVANSILSVGLTFSPVLPPHKHAVPLHLAAVAVLLRYRLGLLFRCNPIFNFLCDICRC
jgi:hypothetical protein